MEAALTPPADPEPIVMLRRATLAQAAGQGVISEVQAAALWSAWSVDPALHAPAAAAGPAFGFTNVLYYFGGLLAIASMSIFMTLGWADLGPAGLLAITLVNIVLCLAGARRLEQRSLPIPASILATLAIVMVPLATWCLQHLLGLWQAGFEFDRFSDYHTYVDGRWLTLEAVTLAAALAMLVRHRHPFMVMPVAVTLWYASMDLARRVAMASAPAYVDEWRLYRDVSLVFGLLTCVAAIGIELRGRAAGSRKDFAFWLYMFGVLMFWSSLSSLGDGALSGLLVYGLVNVAMVFFGAAIGRRVFTVFGGLGTAGFIGDLAHRLFADSLVFPFAMCLLGLGIVALGVWWQRHEAALQQRLAAHLPAFLRPLAAEPA